MIIDRVKIQPKNIEIDLSFEEGKSPLFPSISNNDNNDDDNNDNDNNNDNNNDDDDNDDNDNIIYLNVYVK